jgi:periplasmic protein TonB
MSKEKKNRVIAIAGTALFHALLLLGFILLALRTPLPLPGEEGVEVNLGYTEVGTGRVQQPVPEPPSAPPPRPDPVPVKEELVTQDAEETLAIPASKEKKVEPKPEPEPEPVPEPEPEPDPEPPKVDPRALYRGRTQYAETGQSEGNTRQPGDQGRPDGSPDSPDYEGIGGAEEGISYDLGGRSKDTLAHPKYLSREEAIVVVRIGVDRNGTVVFASPDGRGTTTANPLLRQAARNAALHSRFIPDPNAPDEQRGTIKYKFLRQN